MQYPGRFEWTRGHDLWQNQLAKFVQENQVKVCTSCESSSHKFDGTVCSNALRKAKGMVTPNAETGVIISNQ